MTYMLRRIQKLAKVFSKSPCASWPSPATSAGIEIPDSGSLAPSVGEVFISLLVVGALVAGVGLAAWVLLARLASLAIFANSFASAAGPATLAGADVATGAATLAGADVATGAATLAGADVATGAATLAGADVATGAATLAGADVATGAATLAGATGLTLFFFSSAAFLSTSFLAAACFFFAKSAFAFFRSAFDAPQAELISKLQYFNQVALKQFLTAAWRCYSLLYFLAILMTLLQTALLIFI
jgi:hypothetical protein